jgi:hypothetical protein
MLSIPHSILLRVYDTEHGLSLDNFLPSPVFLFTLFFVLDLERLFTLNTLNPVTYPLPPFFSHLSKLRMCT